MYEKHTLMYKFSYITGRTANITATQCMLNLYSNVRKTEHHVQKRHMYFACDVRSDAHYGRYANGCKIVHWRFSDVASPLSVPSSFSSIIFH